MKEYIFHLNPAAKPRMVRSDKWKKRSATDRYWAFKDQLILQANLSGLQSLPDSIEMLTFVVPMPDSWSEKKKALNDKTPHKQRPDLDNMLKALQDCLCKEDNYIWCIGRLTKVWGRTGKILIGINDNTV